MFDVFQGVAVPVPGDCDRIESVLQMLGAESRDPDASDVLNLAALFPRHGFQRMPVTAACTRLDLDERDGVGATYDDVDFLAIHAVAPLEDVPALGAQKIGCNVFGSGAALMMLHAVDIASA